MSKLKFFYSSMGAGKSLDLLRINDNYNRLDKHCILLKPSIDTRWSPTKIISRIGVDADCETFSSTDDLSELISSYSNFDCVLLDEAQFLTKSQVWQLSNVVDFLNTPVICFGLRTDYNGNVFPGSEVLLGIADEIKEIVMLCHCGRKAIMTARFDKDTNQIIKETDSEESIIRVGDSDYTALCRKHWVTGKIK